MTYKEIEISEFKNWKIHFTPIKNKDLILKHGLLLPISARKVIGHVSPYDAFETTKILRMKPNEEKDKYTYFGQERTETFKHWFSDKK